MKLETDDDLVKESIILASKDVFRRFGYSKVVMDDISKASGKGRSTLYYYFRNKQEVFEDFATNELRQIIGKAMAGIDANKSLEENLLVYNISKIKSFKKLLIEYNMFLDDIRKLSKFSLKIHKLQIKEETEVVKNILSIGRAKGEISKHSDEDIEFLAETMVIAFRSFEIEMVLFKGMDSFEDKLQWLIGILVKGLQ